MRPFRLPSQARSAGKGKLFPHWCFRLVGLCVAFFCVLGVRAETPSSPLRLLPDQADLLIQVPQPRRLVETLTTLDTLKQLQQVAPIRELLGSTKARRFTQLVAYFEKELGLPWPQLLDRLAARGAVLGIKLGPSPAPTLLVIQGDDDKLMTRFFQLGLQILEQELARQEAKDRPVKGSYEGIDTVRIGTKFYAAVAGAALFLSNSEKALHAGLDQHRNGGKKSMADVPGVHEAAKLLPPQSLASFWLKMEKLRQSPGAKAAYKSLPRNDPAQTVLFGHYLDLLGRSPFVCAAVYPSSDGLAAAIVIPRGRDGMGGDKLLHVPPAGVPGSRPLLEPKNVLYSESSYFNLANIWTERATLFTEKQVRQLEGFEKKSAPFLIGTKLSKLLMQAGPYYRFVAAHQTKVGYKTTPKISIPAFALVWELREPEAFGKSMEAVLRGAALLGGAQVNLQLVEEKYKDCKLVGYRFPEDKSLKGDINDLRFNFTPCFTRVGDQFVVSSTIDLCRELVDLLDKEGSSPTRGDASSARMRFYGSGVAAYLHTIEELLITQTTLDQAVTPKEAREQVKRFLDIIRGFGALSLEPRFNDKTFRYDFRLRPEK
ncbi:MAG TPA: hypothetical protein VMG10_03130 [Gemmataceae bacterium]|nr:hypothetical protein [Gemmataceae bacterium]